MSSSWSPLYTVPASRRFSLSHRIDIVQDKFPCLWAGRSVDLCWVRISLMHLSAFPEGLIGGVGVLACKCVRVCTHKHPRVQKPSTLLITSNALMPDKLSGMFYPWGYASLGARIDSLPFVHYVLWTLQRLSHPISLLPPAPAQVGSLRMSWTQQKLGFWLSAHHKMALCMNSHRVLSLLGLGNGPKESSYEPARILPFLLGLGGQSLLWCSRSPQWLLGLQAGGVKVWL